MALLDRTFAVVEGSAYVAGPLAGLTLAQLGAEVIRYDRPGGGIDFRRWPIAPTGRSLFWDNLNRGKKSVAIDVTRPAGRELVADLAVAVGALLSSFELRGSLAPTALRARRRDMLTLRILGNFDGSTAVDYTVAAGIGVPMLTGPEDGSTPTNSPVPTWDITTGLLASTALCAAHARRVESGEGEDLTIALSDAALSVLTALGMLPQAQLGLDRPRTGNDIYGAFGGTFHTDDGRHVMVAAISLRQWERLVMATGTEQELAGLQSRLGVTFADEGARFEFRAEIRSILERWFAARSLAQVDAELSRHGVCWEPYATLDEVAARDVRLSVDNPAVRMVDVHHAAYRALIEPIRSAPARDPVTPLTPALGEHTEEVLTRYLALSTAEIGRLHDRGVVACVEVKR